MIPIFLFFAQMIDILLQNVISNCKINTLSTEGIFGPFYGVINRQVN